MLISSPTLLQEGPPLAPIAHQASLAPMKQTGTQCSLTELLLKPEPVTL